jgi:hypothetical protein
MGRLTMSSIKPRGVVASVRDLRVGAEVSGPLTVSLVNARTGGTVWRSRAAARQNVGRVSLSDAHPSVAVRNPDDANREIVRELVTGVTRNLRPTWVRQ